MKTLTTIFLLLVSLVGYGQVVKSLGSYGNIEGGGLSTQQVITAVRDSFFVKADTMAITTGLTKELYFELKDVNDTTTTEQPPVTCNYTIDYSQLGTYTEYNNIDECYDLTDGTGDYSNNIDKGFWVTNANVGSGLTIEFSAFSLAAGDTLFVQYYSDYNGNTGNYAYEWTSTNPPTLDVVITLQRFVWFKLTTDGANVSTGFAAKIIPL